MVNTDIHYHLPIVVFDLDDTLYKERDFVRSAFNAIERHTSIPNVAQAMWETFLLGGNPMDKALSMSSVIPYEISDLLNIYRFHKPVLTLPDDSRSTLGILKEQGIRMFIITDGRSISQRNKIKALGLDEYFPPENIFISEETGNDKTSPESFRTIVRKYPEAREFIYIGDNPAKDFQRPNLMGWRTIMIRDIGGVNIHPQNTVCASLHRASHVIDSISEILPLILK